MVRGNEHEHGHEDHRWFGFRKLTLVSMLSTVYTINDEGLKEDGAVVGLAGEFVNHAYWRPGSAVAFLVVFCFLYR